MAIERRFNADRLMRLRKERGITAAEMAKRIGCIPDLYRKYEHGTVAPSAAATQLLALLLGTTTAYLYGETDDPAPDMIVIPADGSTADFVHEFSELNSEQRELILGMIRAFRKCNKS